MAELPIIRHLGDDRYEIESTSGKTYFMEADRGICSCPSWGYRCRETPGKKCKHLELLADLLSAQRACPVCHGRAFIWPAFPHADEPGKGLSTDPIPCRTCEGTGLRSGCDPHFLRLHEEGDARIGGAFEMSICPDCEGAGIQELFTLCGGYRGRIRRECPLCKGAGAITPEQLERVRHGDRMREERLGRGLTQRQEAKRLGISVVELSQREAGR